VSSRFQESHKKLSKKQTTLTVRLGRAKKNWEWRKLLALFSNFSTTFQVIIDFHWLFYCNIECTLFNIHTFKNHGTFLEFKFYLLILLQNIYLSFNLTIIWIQYLLYYNYNNYCIFLNNLKKRYSKHFRNPLVFKSKNAYFILYETGCLFILLLLNI